MCEVRSRTFDVQECVRMRSCARLDLVWFACMSGGQRWLLALRSMKLSILYCSAGYCQHLNDDWGSSLSIIS